MRGEISHHGIGEHRAKIIGIDRAVAQYVVTIAGTAQEIVAHQAVYPFTF